MTKEEALKRILFLFKLYVWIEKNYSEQYEESRYFAAVCKGTLMNFAVDGKENGSIVL